MTLVLKNDFNFLAIVPIGHDKFVIFIVLAMVAKRMVIMVVPFAILVHAHKMKTIINGFHHFTFNTYDDLQSIIFVLVEFVDLLSFVKLTHTLNHLKKLHYIVVNETYISLLNFKHVMCNNFLDETN
jgi:hypothetical protein